MSPECLFYICTEDAYWQFFCPVGGFQVPTLLAELYLLGEDPSRSKFL